ncbi:dTDP-4-dehydrorhamnose reductase [Legionella lansingensis]|uniref:dTDP-4-dehydrorhamnose reductase n=1 Tax=Legionella lansingensis TaxID=45067 RepID=A0A0W0VWD8_9GAMM|nr:SDR family oxidoreductase [Legionella lansingensis]KTD24338.1 dTDP-4-dehydrorhamnose reductase [Legionella lansingensis]SNV51745.1 dTDP-4-dehydrorhamnose reductase [Legionella lansingensis]
MKILVLGATGMLGSAIFRTLQNSEHFDVYGTLRDIEALRYFPVQMHAKLISNIDVLDEDKLISVFERVRPNLVINCVGLIKQLACANDPLIVLPINAMFPHRLAKVCAQFETRMIHISTDCVFSGRKGAYVESDRSDAEDLYGKSKFIGEIPELSHVLTLRTSIIGHELNSHYALIDWFLSQKEQVKGYVNAIFSGLPTVELTRVMRDFVIPRFDLSGLYHVAAKPINKYDLLNLVAEIYGKKIIIIPDEQVVIDRSLNAQRFREATGYVAPEWPQLIEMMHKSHNFSGDALNA